MDKDMKRVMVEITVHRILALMKESPRRAIRNLVDLGLEFSNGGFQKRFLQTIQEMLKNQHSAYYTLVSDAVNAVDSDILTTFGVNLGYNGCTKGAEVIRALEAEKGFNIPWSLSLVINETKLESEPEFYPDLLKQGASLGIHTYLLFTLGDAEKIIPLVRNSPNCAFVLFVRGHQVTTSLIEKMKDIKNVMFVVYDNEDMPSACHKLRQAKRLYGVYLRYTERDKERILNNEWFQSLIPIKPACVILRTDEPGMHQFHQAIYTHVLDVRDSQKYPFVVMDIKYDILAIDRIISEGECAAGFDDDGSLRTHEGINHKEEYNIFNHRLEDVLRAIETASDSHQLSAIV